MMMVIAGLIAVVGGGLLFWFGNQSIGIDAPEDPNRGRGTTGPLVNSLLGMAMCTFGCLFVIVGILVLFFWGIFT